MPAGPLRRLATQACSNCAGDYEDPDRTSGDEFPAEWEGDDIDESGCGVDAVGEPSPDRSGHKEFREDLAE